MHNIAGVTVLYHPDSSWADNVRSYLGGLGLLYIIDNSEREQTVLPPDFKTDPRIVYIKNPSNLGMAEPLNMAATGAADRGFDFLLTMDQDSAFQPGGFEMCLRILEETDVAKVGILGPVHVHDTSVLTSHAEELMDVPFTFTSGNLLNLKAFRAAGPFDNTLFIDHVDHEYCLRLRTHGYRIVTATRIQLVHALGYVTEVKILGRTLLRFVSHSPVRTYYMIRNGLVVARRYRRAFPDFYKLNRSLIVKEIIKILFEKDKLKRLRMVFLAVNDAKAPRMGKLEL